MPPGRGWFAGRLDRFGIVSSMVKSQLFDAWLPFQSFTVMVAVWWPSRSEDDRPSVSWVV